MGDVFPEAVILVEGQVVWSFGPIAPLVGFSRLYDRSLALWETRSFGCGLLASVGSPGVVADTVHGDVLLV